MGARRKHRSPARTPEAREQQIVSDALDLIHTRILDGTASAQETVTFAKFGTGREDLERERLSQENEKLRAQIENMATAKRIEELYEDAIAAMRGYSGQEEYIPDEDEYDDY